jgi:hypothetical protein
VPKALAAPWRGLRIVNASRIAVLLGASIKVVETADIPSEAKLTMPRNPGAIG